MCKIWLRQVSQVFFYLQHLIRDRNRNFFFTIDIHTSSNLSLFPIFYKSKTLTDFFIYVTAPAMSSILHWALCSPKCNILLFFCGHWCLWHSIIQSTYVEKVTFMHSKKHIIKQFVMKWCDLQWEHRQFKIFYYNLVKENIIFTRHPN